MKRCNYQSYGFRCVCDEDHSTGHLFAPEFYAIRPADEVYLSIEHERIEEDRIVQKDEKLPTLAERRRIVTNIYETYS